MIVVSGGCRVPPGVVVTAAAAVEVTVFVTVLLELLGHRGLDNLVDELGDASEQETQPR